MLEKLNVLDLTTEAGWLCGKLLGDLGANVIKVEPPGGDPGRRRGPFYKKTPDPEKSLFWFAVNANKRGITLNIESGEGRDLLTKLIRETDCIVESFALGTLEKLRLDYTNLEKMNPGVILTSITPFGQEGPRKGWKASDLVCMAMGGFLHLCGAPDRAPVGVSLPHGYFFAGADAAVGTMIAYYRREQTGVGQWVDVSIQQSVAMTCFNSVPWWQLQKVIQGRMGAFRKIGLFGGLVLRQTWPCKNGYVIFILTAGAFGARTNQLLTEWMDSEGMAPEFMKKMDWKTLDAKSMAPDFIKAFDEHVMKFFLSHTKEELYEGAVRKGMQLYPVYDCAALAESPQLRARHAWQPVEHPELGMTMTYPGAWVKMSEGICQIRRRAPLIGEHNIEVYHDGLGLPLEEVERLKGSGVI
jgi:crotonobetainyl-CoA:carnitine CoA-transferase CaiB-like acyl-CoA transferase